MRKFWIIIACIALTLIVIMSISLFKTTSTNTDTKVYVAYLGIWGLALCSFFLSSNFKIKEVVRNSVIWGTIFFGFMFGYNMRYELQDILSTLSAGTIPASPVTRVTENGRIVTVDRDQNGHFMINGLLNDKPVRMLIDTGASIITLTKQDAIKIGIDVSSLNYTIPISTANGSTVAAATMVKKIKIGDIERNNVQALVSRYGNLSESLMGMNYLNRLSGYSVRGDRFILID